MASGERDVRRLIELDRERVRECRAERWGDPMPDGVVASVGDARWFDTHVPGVITMHGNEPGPGPAVIIRDIAHNPTELLSTSGLTGCMGLAIIGYNDDETQDAFLCHARQYDSETALSDENNPLALAKQFVDRHSRVRVIWGTDFSAGNTPAEAQAARQTAQALLSSRLGCWVRDSDRVLSSNWTFCPKIERVFPDKPIEAQAAVERLSAADVEDLKAFNKSKAVTPFAPERGVLDQLEEKRRELRMSLQGVRNVLLDSRRQFKLRVIEMTLDAYRCGNVDVLRSLAQSAERRDAPLGTQASASAWDARGESQTAQWVKDSFTSAVAQTRAMDPSGAGCGLHESGNEIYDTRDYKETVARRVATDDHRLAAASEPDDDRPHV